LKNFYNKGRIKRNFSIIPEKDPVA